MSFTAALSRVATSRVSTQFTGIRCPGSRNLARGLRHPSAAPLERFLERIVILAVAKVADMPHAAQANG
jgi:hypothetical protein